MALIRCLNHAPTESFNHSFVNTLPYEESHCCSKSGCTAKPVIWLNPEEVRRYEDGTRTFQSSDFDSYKTQDVQVSTYTVNYVWQFLTALGKRFSSQKERTQYAPQPVSQKVFN